MIKEHNPRNTDAGWSLWTDIGCPREIQPVVAQNVVPSACLHRLPSAYRSQNMLGPIATTSEHRLTTIQGWHTRSCRCVWHQRGVELPLRQDIAASRTQRSIGGRCRRLPRLWSQVSRPARIAIADQDGRGRRDAILLDLSCSVNKNVPFHFDNR